MASIRKRPNGSWRARYRDDEGKEHARHFERKADAQRWLDDITTSRRTGTYVDPRTSKTTLASFYADWGNRQIWANSTREAYGVAMAGCTFADVEVGKLRTSHVETWVKAMEPKLAPSTIRTRVGNVRTVIRAAVRDRVMASDPTVGVRLPRLRRAEVQMVIPTPEQVGALLEAADEWFRPFIALCAFAGLRIGEASAVQVRDIAFLKRTLHVARQVQKEPGTITVSPPKHGSERIVYIPDELATMLGRHIEEIGVHGDEGWILPGRPPNPDALRYRFNEACAASALEDLTPHDLRHFFASGLIAAGCDVVTVQRALGHAKATTTLNVYGHLWGTAEDRTRAAAADLMRSSIGTSADSSRTADAE